MASMPGSLLHPSLMPALAGLIPLSQGSMIAASAGLPPPSGNRLMFQSPVLHHHHHHPPPLAEVNAILPAGALEPGQAIHSASPPARSLSASASPPAAVSNECEESAELLKELLKEKEALETLAPENKAHILKLIDQEIQRLQTDIRGGCGSGLKDSIKYIDVYRERPIRLTVRVLVPVREHPKFNFVGKLLGPKGNSMKRLQEETMTKMAVLGRGSMRDKQKEEELRASSDPKYQHLNEELHVEITAFAPPAEAHARIAYALTEVRKYLIPDSNDEIRQEQMREMEILAANGGDAALLLAAAAAADPKRSLSGIRPQSTALIRSNSGSPLLATTSGIRNPLVPSSNTFPPLVHKIVSNAVVSTSSSSSTTSHTGPGQKLHGIIAPDGMEFLHLESSAPTREDGLLTGSTEDVLSINGLKAQGAFHDNRMKLRQNIAPY